MFERYTEHARRVIFFARYEASVFGSPEITTTHLLLAVLREGRELFAVLLPAGAQMEQLRREVIGDRKEAAARVSSSVDLPLSMAAKRILAHAAGEAEQLRHRSINLVHLLLGLLYDQEAAAFLATLGIDRERLVAQGGPADPSTDTGAQSRLRSLIDQLPPETHSLAEQALRALLESESQATTRETNCVAGARDVTITQSMRPGTDPDTLDYSVTVKAFGDERSWRTTLKGR